MQSTADKILQHLSTFNIKQDGTNKWRCNSPFRAGSDSMSFCLTVDDGEHGAYIDHVSGESGSLYELAAALGVAIPAAPNVENTKRKYTGRYEYAKAHGISDATLEMWHWREVLHKGRRALEFGTRTGQRWRFIDGNKPHYISEQGYVRCWYGLSDALIKTVRMNRQIIICNGEISTITAQDYGLPAIAVTSGEKEIPAQLIDELRGVVGDVAGLQVIVAMDCDATGIKAGSIIREQLINAGFNVRAVDLGLGLGGDLSDFCMLHGKDAKRMISDLPEIKPNLHSADDRNFHFYTLDEVLRLPPVRWLLRGVLPATGLSMVYGPSGVGKSFWALGLAYELAFDNPIIYVAAEGETGMGVRTMALIQHHKRKPDKLTFVLGAVDLFSDEELTVFKQLSSRYTPRLIVVDTLAMCTGLADENSARDMKIIIDGCKRMARELECAVMLVHHTNKEGRRERGSGSLFAACETVIRITRSDDALVVESQKTKDLKSFDPYYLKEVSVHLGTDEVGEAITSLVLLPAKDVVDTDELTPLQRTILESLLIEPSASLANLADIAEQNNRGVIARAIKKLEQNGMVEPYAGGERKVTAKGRDALDDTPSAPVDTQPQPERSSRQSLPGMERDRPHQYTHA